MIRFIHTADWQIGMKASGLGAAAQVVRDAGLESIERLSRPVNKRKFQVVYPVHPMDVLGVYILIPNR
jgi:hypothetical protein